MKLYFQGKPSLRLGNQRYAVCGQYNLFGFRIFFSDNIFLENTTTDNITFAAGGKKYGLKAGENTNIELCSAIVVDMDGRESFPEDLYSIEVDND